MNIVRMKEQLQELQARRQAWLTAERLIAFDRDTAAPPLGRDGHAAALEAIARSRRSLMMDADTGALLAALSLSPEADAFTRRRARLLLSQRHSLNTLPQELALARARDTALAHSAWLRAREADDFSLLQPYLTRVFEHERDRAACLRPGLPVYDAVLDLHEPGLRLKQLNAFFEVLLGRITPLIREISSRPKPRTDFLHRDYPLEQQRAFAHELMELMGLDSRRCTLAQIQHPFTSAASRMDVRISTHYYPQDVSRSMFSVLHEGGHALYRLNTAPQLDGTAAWGVASAAIDESQSRFAENIIGRSLPFCRAVLPLMKQCFPGRLEDVEPEQLFRAVNAVEPASIRITADELTYPIHIMIRCRLEQAMLEGSLKAQELPGEWNRLYRELLGVEVRSDSLGVMQDMHWTGGFIGYFAVYALGSAYGAQLLRGMELDVPSLWQHISRGDLSTATGWLTEKVHRHGRLKSPGTLLRQALGGDFAPDLYADYLIGKYTDLYHL